MPSPQDLFKMLAMLNNRIEVLENNIKEIMIILKTKADKKSGSRKTVRQKARKKLETLDMSTSSEE